MQTSPTGAELGRGSRPIASCLTECAAKTLFLCLSIVMGATAADDSSVTASLPGVRSDVSENTVDRYRPADIDRQEAEYDGASGSLPVPDMAPIIEQEERLPYDPEDEFPAGLVPDASGAHASVPVSYDLKTGEEVVHQDPASLPEAFSHLPELQHSFGGAGEAAADHWPLDDDNEDILLNFSGLSLVSSASLTSYPYRLAVKVKSFKTDTAGGHWLSSCSGTLIDPTHVITAGHCIYSHTSGSTVFNDWHEEVIVVPAYRQTSSASDPWSGVFWNTSGDPEFPYYEDECRDEPYGCAQATQLHSFTGWTVDEDHDHDIGIVALDRPVGALSGWAGYGWNSNCSHFTSNYFRHSGYPANSPYDGSEMYTNTGDFDSCEDFLGAWYGYEVRFNNQSWGGQSGSGAVDAPSSCPSCWVYAVLSNGTDSYTDDVRLTEGKFASLGSIIDDDTPSTVDLVPMNVRSASSVVAGQRIADMDYLVHNYSSATHSGTFSAEVYLSTNDNISTSDTLIQSHTVTTTIGPKSSTRVNVSTDPLVPSTLSGDYYLGVYITSVDAKTSNNDTDGQDTSEVTVGMAVPPVPSTPSASDGTYTDRVRVIWSSVSAATSYRVYRCTNTSISSCGTYYTDTASPYDDTGAVAGITYYYRLKACNGAGCSDYSGYNSGYRAVSPPPIPATPSASDGTYMDRVRVSWGSVSGATSYRVHRCTSTSTSTCSTYFTDTASPYDDIGASPGVVYYYRLKACNTAGCSDLSSYNSGYRMAAPFVCGDADGNGTSTIVDALAIARSVVGLPPPPAVDPDAADVDGDGIVTIVDALLVARHCAGLPVPGTCF